MDGERETKRVFCPKADSGGTGLWEGLNPELLALIFVRIPPEQLLQAVQFVCKSWEKVIAGPYCWTDIDVAEWCSFSARSSNTIVRRLVCRSGDTVRMLSACKLSNSVFSYVADCGRCLTVLKIPMSGVTDIIVEKHAKSLSKVAVLDISHCLNIASKGIRALGKHCKSLVHLVRNMEPPELHWPYERSSQVDDCEAMDIADTMPGLCHLELQYGRFGDRGLDAILTKCLSLTYLGIEWCSNVEMGGDIGEKSDHLDELWGPWDATPYGLWKLDTEDTVSFRSMDGSSPVSPYHYCWSLDW
ncbi:hypothetical protein NE237_026128 [Protea cynaroides]|uniref:F-box domain-containing protein n=1 Tax=Protea cynaroides TaxID=273540 RepID=A0A9Q0H358_9MAGN|nr:hypothetical protein NE237_026128 [Protea cynaroides]